MPRIEYASELDPLLEVSPPADWLVAVVPKPSQLLSGSELPEEQLFAELLSDGDDERIVATRLAFLYIRDTDSERKTPPHGNRISVSYDPENAQFELSSGVAETTVQSVDAAANWVEDQFTTVETFVDTYLVLIELAEDIDGLGDAGVRGLVETFETLDAIREADVDAVASVPYVDEDNATTLQTILEEIEGMEEGGRTPLEGDSQVIEGPVIVDPQNGPITGELIPSDASNPKYRSEPMDDT